MNKVLKNINPLKYCVWIEKIMSIRIYWFFRKNAESAHFSHMFITSTHLKVWRTGMGIGEILYHVHDPHKHLKEIFRVSPLFQFLMRILKQTVSSTAEAPNFFASVQPFKIIDDFMPISSLLPLHLSSRHHTFINREL